MNTATTPMPLSEAIMRGCKILPKQAFGVFLNLNEPGSGCALAAANAGLGRQPNDPGIFDLYRSLPIICCPACIYDVSGYPPLALAGHLNDAHRWPRERIADLLAKKGL